ncbi:MAG: flap endonuclease [Deltaproteobacteria bacterium]|nr:flap endonuclease [Deltaproteobacteria bacterium]
MSERATVEGLRVHLLDGTYELFRAHFGAPPAKDATGREVGATRGLVRSVAALLSEPQVTHVAAAFDTVIESFRNALFAGYKSGEGLPVELTAQFPLAERALAAMGVRVWGMVEFEADDALATAARLLDADPRVAEVRLCSPDKDLAQCVRGRRVVMVDRMRERVLDEEGVIAKFGVAPGSIPDWLALVGDDADGIPGLARWGAKGAAAVLARYEHLDAIPDDAATWDAKVRGAEALAASLRDGRADALLYRTLATLRTDAPVDASLESLAWQGPRRDLPAVLEELGLGTRVFEQLERAASRLGGARCGDGAG